MEKRTHHAIEESISGRIVSLGPGTSTVELQTTAMMAVDRRGLVHGGFIFSLADHAAMVAVNHPNVVLGRATVRFIAPVVVGDMLVANANASGTSTGKQVVEVEVSRGGSVVCSGSFTCHVLDTHVLDRGG